MRQYGTSTTNGYFSDEKLTKDLLIDNNFEQFYKCLNGNNKIVSKEDVYTLLLSIFQSIQIFFAYRQIYNQKNSKSLIRKIIMIIKSNKLVVNLFYLIKGNFNGNELNSIKVIKLKVIEKYFKN